VAQWVPFTGLTALVLVLLLALARLSQGAVDDPGSRETDDDPGSRETDDDPGSREVDRDSGRAEDDGVAVGCRAETTDGTGGSGDDAGGADHTAGGSVDAGTAREAAAAAGRAPDRTEDGSQVRGAEADGRLDAEAVDPGATGGASGETGRTGGTDLDAQGPGERPAPDRRGPGELSTSALLANVALTQGLFGAVVLGGAAFYDIPAAALGVTGDPWNTGVPALALGAAFGLGLWLANDLGASLADAAGASYDEELRSMLAPDSRAGWAVLLCVVLPIIAGVEEFLFRAAAIGVPAAGFGVSPWALAVLSSVLFALGHGAQGRLGIAVTGTLGFVLAAGYVLSGSLLVVVVAHYVVNALEFLVHEWAGIDRLLA
jgi:membrane protease YdiL (CAAX protease family)